MDRYQSALKWKDAALADGWKVAKHTITETKQILLLRKGDFNAKVHVQVVGKRKTRMGFLSFFASKGNLDYHGEPVIYNWDKMVEEWEQQTATHKKRKQKPKERCAHHSEREATTHVVSASDAHGILYEEFLCEECWDRSNASSE